MADEAAKVLRWLRSCPIALEGDQHELPKDYERRFQRFNPDSLSTAEDHIQKYTDTLKRMQIEYEDVACRMFPSNLEGRAMDWYISLPNASITSWDQLEEAFLQRFYVPLDPEIIFEQFLHTKKFPHEPMRNFNDRFQKAYSRLVDPYTLDQRQAINMYYRALDPFTASFLRREEDIDSLQQAFVAAAFMERSLQQNTKAEKVNNLMYLLGNLSYGNSQGASQPNFQNPALPQLPNIPMTANAVQPNLSALTYTSHSAPTSIPNTTATASLSTDLISQFESNGTTFPSHSPEIILKPDELREHPASNTRTKK